jgi:uncharacterized membrane protein YedE/YeeE
MTPSGMDSWATLQALSGGVLIGVAASVLLAFNGRIAGVSGILGGLLPPRRLDTAWRAMFIAGLVAGGVVLRMLTPDPFHGLAATPYAVLIPAGILVGLGASLGNGCTSGHGVCGVSRLSPRSILATITFMLAGAATVFLVRHLLEMT